MITIRTRFTFIIIIILLLSIIPSTSHGESLTVDSKIQINTDPTMLKLRPGQDGTISITIKNIGNETMSIYFEMRYTEAFGHADILNDGIYFSLDRGEQRNLEIRVNSQARPYQDPDISDISIELYYGTNLILNEYDNVDLNTVDEIWTHTYNIEDDYLFYNILIISIIILVIASFVYIRRKRFLNRREITDEETEGHDNTRIGGQ